MKIQIIAMGKSMPAWVETGFKEYAKRLPRECSLKLHEISLTKRGKHPDLARLIKQEGQQMLAAIPKQNRVIALSIEGRPYDTPSLATQLAEWMQDGQDVSLLIGGPEGLAPECLARADSHWSLSPLTLPHPLVRVILAEQIYRAWTILKDHPYHR